MKYERIAEGTFLERENRFIASVMIDGKAETVHVKNTGRCGELFVRGASVWVQKTANPQRKTKWDLICVKKGGRLVNVDSQAPNQTVKDWLESEGLFKEIKFVKPETTYGNSRFDFYIEAGERKIFMEVKGVTLENEGVVRFPDAPSERAVKHVEELVRAVKEGYEAYILFVVQMKEVRYFTPNCDTHPAFCEALKKAKKAGVKLLAYDCCVEKDSIEISQEVPVVLLAPLLMEALEPLVQWYRQKKRSLPWRENPDAYRVWVSEIMLQQTRVEAVKPYYERFLAVFPTVKDLAQADEDLLLKMWEGLGYYNRARNMQKAAQQIMIEYQGEFPHTYEEIHKLPGIGNYTAGAISSFAYGIPKPAVDGNVLRVVSRILALQEDIMKGCVRAWIEEAAEEVIPINAASDFNQGLIELGAIVCVPGGEPKCGICPVSGLCRAKKLGIQSLLPIRIKAKERRIEKRTVLIFRDEKGLAIRKRPAKGLLAGLYELPNVEGHLDMEDVVAYGKSVGLTPVRVKKLGGAKHIFSHVEWHMIGYEVIVDELEKNCGSDLLFADGKEIKRKYPIPSAFSAYAEYIRFV